MGNVRRGAAVSAVRGRRARHAGADHRAHGARARHRHRSRTAAPRPATTRCASRSRCARWRPSSRCWRRCATRPSSARTSSTTCSSRSLPVPPYRRRVLRQPRPVGRDHRRHGDADLHRQHPRRRLGADARCVHAAARRRDATRSRFEQGRPVALDGARCSAGRAHRGARDAGARPSASAAASTSATPSSAPRAASPSRRPAAEVLLTAHRELEKLVLTGAPAAHQGAARAALRRPGARGPAARSGVPRHRGAAAVLAGARHRRGARAAAARQRCSSKASSRPTR